MLWKQLVSGWRHCLASMAVGALCWSAQSAFAQAPASDSQIPTTLKLAYVDQEEAVPNAPKKPNSNVVNPSAGNQSLSESKVIQAGCSKCGASLLLGDAPPVGGEAGGGCAACCIPGKLHCCSPCNTDSCLGKFFCGLYECLCCPDPCYEPRWLPAANASFFVDSARPATYTRLRFDGQYKVLHPDRAEYFIPRSSINFAVPTTPPFPAGFGKGPKYIAKTIDVSDFSLYTEAAIDKIGVFAETSYREMGPQAAPVNAPLGGDPVLNQSGFGDINLGTKTLLLDCELLQFGFQFKTYLPVGSFTKNLGTGHVALEPALLFTLKVSPDCYLQGQFAYWIPIAGDPLFQSEIFHAHFSLNHVIYRILPDVQIIGTLELNEWSVLGGNYAQPDVYSTSDTKAFAVSGNQTLVSMGPGIRLDICNKVDFGVGSAFAVTGNRWAREHVRVELRWRF